MNLRSINKMRLTTITMVVYAALLASCSSMSGEQIVREAAGLVVVQKAKDNYIEDCVRQKNPEIDCDDRFDDIQAEGEKAWDERERSEGRSRPDRLTEDFDEFFDK